MQNAELYSIIILANYHIIKLSHYHIIKLIVRVLVFYKQRLVPAQPGRGVIGQLFGRLIIANIYPLVSARHLFDDSRVCSWKEGLHLLQYIPEIAGTDKQVVETWVNFGCHSRRWQ